MLRASVLEVVLAWPSVTLRAAEESTSFMGSPKSCRCRRAGGAPSTAVHVFLRGELVQGELSESDENAERVLATVGAR
jgi:hypothetical protein